ncbi:MAG: hypothetical protein OEY36_09065 [Gammaproteobacteria bacterium]|nr:hypothetical protein [Gammaproteobacteria bacterium]
MRRLLSLLLVFYTLSCSATEQELADVLFSEIMFYRMQDDNFDAISHYLTAKESASLTLDNNSMAYVASVYLNYDLHSQVSGMLDLLTKNESVKIRNKAWFYLGKLHYKGRRVSSAATAFSKIEGDLSAANQQMKNIMYGIMAMNNKQYDTAIKELQKVAETSPFTSYVKYNIAICMMRKNADIAAFEKSLTALANAAAIKNQADAFTDQIYTTLGYVLLQGGHYQQSKLAFRKVLLHGHLGSRALQGMIYASSELKQYELALNLSLRLIKQTVGNEAIHHAYIVIPYLLQKIDNREKAMAFYQYAVEYFGQQRLDLSHYIEKTGAGEFDRYLLDLDKILHVDEWLTNKQMSRLFRYVSTLDEWRDAVYKYREMTFVEKRLEQVFYQLVIAEPDVTDKNKARYQESVAAVEKSKAEVRQSIEWHQKFARHFIIDTLRAQYDEVTDYLSQARFALAQFYDKQELKQQQLETEQLIQQALQQESDAAAEAVQK